MAVTARRRKINRHIGTPDDTQILRLDVYRRDDDGARFRSSMSVDPATMELALALHGSTVAAKEWMQERAEALWEEDRQLRLAARAQGREHAGEASISRDVAREVIEAATTRLLSGPTATSSAPSPSARPRRSKAATTASGERMAGALVELTLHDDGRLSGRVLADGRDLRDLSIELLLALLTDAGELDDKTDQALLTAFLDHRHPDWRTAVSGGSDDIRDDRDFLGLPPGADGTQIKLAHRRLLMRVHPDHGGTPALAARLNLARDRLLAALVAAPAAGE